MGNVQKVITAALWGVLVLVMFGVVVGRFVLRKGAAADTPAQTRPTNLFPAPEFTLTDQNGKEFSSKQLKGHPWIGDIIFTRCGGVCPIMSSKMTALQESTPKSVRLVSFSVDPEFDTPKVLKEYAERFKADESRWTFLTGPKETIFDVAQNGLKLSAVPAGKDNVIVHSEKFVLADADGTVYRVYNSKDEEQMKELVADAKLLADRAQAGAKGSEGGK